MDFIERWFDLAPDHGDGSLETLIVLAAVVVAAVSAIAWIRRHRGSSGTAVAASLLDDGRAPTAATKGERK